MNELIKLSGIQKFLLFGAVIGVILWLGGSVTRAAIAFDLFIPGTLNFKTLSPEVVAQTARLFGVTAFYTLTGYGLALVGIITLFVSLRMNWKSHGWIFIAGVLFLVYIPVEVIQAYWEIKLIFLTNGGIGTFLPESATELILKRLKVLSGIPLLAMLGYITAISMLVWRPLTRKMKQGISS